MSGLMVIASCSINRLPQILTHPHTGAANHITYHELGTSQKEMLTNMCLLKILYSWQMTQHYANTSSKKESFHSQIRAPVATTDRRKEMVWFMGCLQFPPQLIAGFLPSPPPPSPSTHGLWGHTWEYWRLFQDRVELYASTNSPGWSYMPVQTRQGGAICQYKLTYSAKITIMGSLAIICRRQ